MAAIDTFVESRATEPAHPSRIGETRMRNPCRVWKHSIALAVAIGLVSCSGVPDAAWRALIDATDYAPGLSEAGFNETKAGMTEAEVIRALGQPFWKRTTVQEGETWMEYTRLKGMEGSHYVRIVILGKGGRVTRVIADFIDVGRW